MTTWGHAAHSIPRMGGDGRYSFRVPAGVSGVVVGLSAQDSSTRYDEATHALLFRAGHVWVLESGARKGAALGYVGGDHFHIVRVHGRVYYCRAAVPPASHEQAKAVAFFVSGVPSAGEVVLDATLFAPGDAILDGEYADITDVAGDAADPTAANGVTARLAYTVRASGVVRGGGGRVGAKFPAMVVRAVEPAHWAQVRARFAGVRVRSSLEAAGVRFDVTAPRPSAVMAAEEPDTLYALAWASDQADSIGEWVTERATAHDRMWSVGDRLGVQEVVLALDARRMAVRSGLYGQAVALDGVAWASVHRLTGAASASAAASVKGGVSLLDGVAIFGRADADGEGVIADQVTAQDGWALSRGGALASIAYATDAVLAVAGTGSVALQSVALAVDAAWTGGVRSTQITDAAVPGDQVLCSEPAVVAWVMNAETGAVSWYGNWQFTDAVQLPDGRVLAVGPGGVSEWVGERDGDEPVQAHVFWGLQEFGGFDQDGNPRPQEQRKRLTQLTVGYHAALPMRATLHAFAHGQRPYTYAMPARVAGQAEWHRNHRILPGRGLSARYWRVGISGAGPFQVHHITADVATSSRRM